MFLFGAFCALLIVQIVLYPKSLTGASGWGDVGDWTNSWFGGIIVSIVRPSRPTAVLIVRALLVATGSRYRRLDIPGEEALIGINVHFCATCDGPFYQGKEVLVVGGGNSGFQEGLFLTRFASKVTIVEFMPQLDASAILQEKVTEHNDIEVLTHHAVQEFIVEDNVLKGVRVLDRASGEVKVLCPEGVFVFIGLSPNSDFLPPEIERDRWGFVVTEKHLETFMKGVFAAGDVRAWGTKQAASAAGEGATAALMLREFLRRG